MIKTEQADYTVIENGTITSPAGFQAGGVAIGIRKHNKLDLGWVSSESPAAAAGVYTLNAFRAAPLLVTEESIGFEGKLQGIVVNSGIANACTGEEGLANAYAMRKAFAEKLGIQTQHAAVASTGLIGVQLPMDKVMSGIHAIKGAGKADEFATAILTTDTCTKQIAVSVEIDGMPITIGGAAKGSGMIHPNMATMLAFVTTDAAIPSDTLEQLLKKTTDGSYNMITVDGDTSTNDMVLALANGKAGNKELTPSHPEWEKFSAAFQYVSQELAKKIARDGEGATKLVEVRVQNAKSEAEARKIGKAVVASSLVKAAVYGADPNWGRIITAAGYSGASFSPDKISVWLGDSVVVQNGSPVVFDEAEASKHLKQETVLITIDLQDGDGEATAWGCDLSYDYVKINASYRT
ncbi:bifunctional glutamate N-acetyltransferase/amino-acid acetyltransferase ArgJ [Terribacillus sp. 7520-G]|uniref:bifunctional glutamate N-acetyltransferase/amino-acid acetyltransferase ArgJ n=1 Tax=Terribacillus TaxID=459532 RepID=UPI000BA6DD0D|nr:bifunctional glutamate N-acetyltransferase/amino-acid acetyltransferase ArgJ [Terribacillus sp. 7520-G]PAD40609.1 bifunctional ornithine acetyltransferase/N-acetylglutamate synthase [Terribacillus sp. 7520-G]